MRTCEACEAELGPWEDGICPVLLRMRRPLASLNNADAAVLVLEGSDVPLSVYDIERGIARELGKSVNRGSLNVSLANDMRFCWAGRGIYGLFRHGLIPGPRHLAGIGRFFIYSYGSSIALADLEFVMKYAGYSFTSASLTRALTDDDDVYWPTWSECDVHRSPSATHELRRTGIAPDHQTFLDLAERCRETIFAGFDERERRLAGESL